MRSRVRRGYYSRRRLSGGSLALLILVFWVVTGLVTITFINQQSSSSLEASGKNIAKMYIGSIFPSISRASDFESRKTMAPIDSATDIEEKLREKNGLLKSMVGSMFPVMEILDDDLAEEDPGIIFNINGSDDWGSTDQTTTPVIDTQNTDVPKPATANIDYSKPVVIIYHTHATESYQPVSDGNFHSINEYGTVREVGNVIASELEAKGIQVIHDKTIHDSPSYNQSYTRSLETVQKLMGENSSACIIVDLHRDAASYTGNVGKTVKIKKDTVATYSLVVGTGNPNAEALKVFANYINKKAEELYPGFGGKIIEKQYKFNQHVSDYHILLEVGNNENTIDQVKLTGKYFANVLAEAIKDIE